MKLPARPGPKEDEVRAIALARDKGLIDSATAHVLARAALGWGQLPQSMKQLREVS